MWQKFLDETISRSTFMALLFLIPLFFIDLTPENAKVYQVLAGLCLATGVAKTVQNTMKAKYNGTSQG